MSESSREDYKGREQASVKHMLLRRYLVRLFMILGQKETTINYVDCFAGPWKSEKSDLSDTSFGIACEEMKKCFHSLRAKFGREVKFRALFIEKDKSAYEKLEEYVKANTSSQIELYSMHGDFLKLIPEIAQWSSGRFTFFFIDPKGWKDVSAPKLKQLLEIPKSEFMINFMYDFANRGFAQPDKFEKHIVELLGYVPDLSGFSPGERQLNIINLYRAKLKTVFGDNAYSSFLPIERPGQDRVLYYLVYLSRHPSGIDAFKNEAEKTEEFQAQMQVITKLDKKAMVSATVDMFGSDTIDQSSSQLPRSIEISVAKLAFLRLLEEGPVKIDMVAWAKLLETNTCLPTDFQMAIRDLVAEEVVENLDADLKRRRSKFLVPKNCERWIIKK